MSPYLPTRANRWQTPRLVGARALAYVGAVAIGLHKRYRALITAIVVTRLSDVKLFVALAAIVTVAAISPKLRRRE